MKNLTNVVGEDAVMGLATKKIKFGIFLIFPQLLYENKIDNAFQTQKSKPQI